MQPEGQFTSHCTIQGAHSAGSSGFGDLLMKMKREKRAFFARCGSAGTGGKSFICNSHRERRREAAGLVVFNSWVDSGSCT